VTVTDNTDTHREPPPPEAPPPDDYGPAVPHDHAAERTVLGAMLRDRRAIEDVLDLVAAPDFYRPAHEQIFDAILDLFGRGDPVDPITVGDTLRRRGTLRKLGGEAYLHDLVSAAPISANADYYAEIVRERATLRRMVVAGNRIVELGTTGGEPVDDLFARALTELATARPAVSTTGAHPWAPVDLTEILANGETLEQPTVLERVDGFALLYPGTVHSVAGEPETGKSWVAILAAAQELKAGAHVTFADFEDRPGRVVGRLLLLGVPPERISERFHYIRPMTRLDAAGAQHIEHAASRSSLVVLDGVTEAMSLHGLDLNDQKDIAAFLALLPRRLADLGPAVLQIDHLPKLTDSHNRFAIGGQHKLAGLDGAAYLVKVIDPFGRGKKGRAILTVAKDREGAVREHTAGNTIAELVIDATGPDLVVALEVPRGSSRSDDASFRPTRLMEKISRYIEEHPGESGRQIEQNVPGNAKAKRDALRILALENWIEGIPGTRGSVHYTSVTPYREDDDQ
jgi:hypothetical protein